jgi:ferri-bacillibactin esterase
MPDQPEGRAGPARPFTLEFAESFDITSRAGAAYRISVGLPRSYASSDQAYPVLYVLDAHDHFPTALDIARLRGMTGELAEIIVVGVGYPAGTPMKVAATRRMYDFSTANWDRTTAIFREQEEMMALAGFPWHIGGAPAMLEFLVDDLQPVVDQRYRVDPDDRGLFGCSAGGNFAGYTLFERTGAFDKYILASPAFYFSDFEVVRLEESFASGHADLAATIYIGAGSDETLQYAHIPIVSGTALLAEALHRRRYPSLRLTCEFLPGKRHLNASTELLQRGMEVCWPGVLTDITVDKMKEHSIGERFTANSDTLI